MNDREIPPFKKEESNPIKEEILEEEGKKLSRDIARKYIYVRNKEKYPLPFEEYKIYHIDGKLFNDSVDNLYLCTKEQRKALYEEQLKRRKPFSSAKEIDLFLEKLGKISPEISKDKKIYERRYSEKVPLYWKQKEIRKRQLETIDPHPELKRKLIEEIKNKEEEIEQKEEEKRLYSLPPKRHPELKRKLIEEIREAEIKNSGQIGRKMNKLEKTILVVGILAVIGLLIFFFKDAMFDKTQEIKAKPFNLAQSKLQIGSSSEQLFSYEIRTDRYFMLIINNEKQDIKVEIEYNRYSQALGINENKTIQVSVPKDDQLLIKDPGFARDLGCLENDCEVNILYSKKI